MCLSLSVFLPPYLSLDVSTPLSPSAKPLWCPMAYHCQRATSTTVVHGPIPATVKNLPLAIKLPTPTHPTTQPLPPAPTTQPPPLVNYCTLTICP